MECKECDYQIVRQEKSNKDWMLKRQCKNCGQQQSSALKFELIGGKQNIFKIPILDEAKLQEFYDFQKNKRNNKYQLTLEGRRKEYYAYLQTSEWKSKRDRVMKRDNNTCQACLKRTASDVHHLTYKNIYNEPLFDLVAICRTCHEALHEDV